MTDERGRGSIYADVDRDLEAAIGAWLDEHRPGPYTVDEAVGLAVTLVKRAAAILMQQSGAALSDPRAHLVTTSKFIADLAYGSHFEACRECRELNPGAVHK